MNSTTYFTTRRSVRQYSSREIPDAELADMIEAASHAPTTGNMQLYSVVVTRSEEGKKALAPAHFNQPCLTNANVVLTFCADFNRFVKWCNVNNADPGYDNFQSFISAMLDTVIVAQQFCTIAEMRGIGCCYLGTTTWNAPQIADALALPRLVIPVITVTLGYPDGEAMVSDRLPIEAIMHTEQYKDYDEDTIHKYYAPKEALKENIQFVVDNGKQTLAQVFTDIRYPREANEHFSKIFLDFLVAQGYLAKPE